ncbi:MAG: hypothetical protein K6G16_06265 [Lachnospiraceae bacterium]|nr:hypothetical protein [Lachnospiraceae bacterium]
MILLFCTRSSPLYPFNNWDDVNSYFSMGKGMMNGMVPYRDLFDQKGILLYFLYGLCYLVSHTSFIGAFVLEIAAAALHLWAVLKISLLLAGRAQKAGRTADHDVPGDSGRMICYFLLPLYGACVYSTRCMWYGGSAEELMLPLFAWGLWLLFRVLDPGEAEIGRCIFIAGLLAGCVLHIKFNSLGFFFGWMAAVFFCRLRRDGILKSLLHCLIFLGGMGAATLPWLLYFLFHHAVRDWFRVTIWLNLFVYSEKLPLAERIYTVAKTLYTHFLDNPAAFVPAALGLLWFLLSRRMRASEKIAVVSTGAFLTLGIFIGGVSLPYYPLPLTVYALFAIPAAAGVTDVLTGLPGVLSGNPGVLRRKETEGSACNAPDKEDVAVRSGRERVIRCLPAAVVIILLSAAAIARFSMNMSYLGTAEADVWQFRFRDDIEASGIEDPTLLNMNCFDAGLYCLADIVPSCYFFQTQTIHLDDVYLSQRENLRRGDTDFVLAREWYPNGIDEHYVEIDSATADYFGEEEHFYLFMRKDPAGQ